MPTDYEAALDMLDAATYRLFGGTTTRPKTIHNLSVGNRIIMMQGLDTTVGPRSLIAMTLRHDGTREVEVHTDDCSRCQSWKLTRPHHLDRLVIMIDSPCDADREYEIPPSYISQELARVGGIFSQAEGSGSAFDVVDIHRVAERGRTSRFPPNNDLFEQLSAALEPGKHHFHFDGTRQYVQLLREKIPV